MSETSPLAGIGVLVVDDEPFSRVVAAGMLRSIGCAPVVEAVGGKEALEQLAAMPQIALVVTDARMPQVDGVALLRAIRRGKAGVDRALPVVMLTGRTDRDLIGAAVGLDVHAFIVKPAKKAMLQRRLEQCLIDRIALRSPEDYDRVGGAVALPPAGASNATLIPAATAVPGQVLAADLVTPGGVRLLSAGDALTSRVLDILCDMDTLGDGVSTLPVIRGAA